MTRPRIPYGRQTISFTDRFRVGVALGASLITQGARVTRFESALASKVGAEYAIAFSSGTAALHAAAAVGGANSSTTALVPNLTFVATANAPRYSGAEIRIGDISSENWNLDPAGITQDVDMVLPVHFAGLPVELDSPAYTRSRAIVIEDAAHALGAYTKDGPIGNCARSDMTCFSFHPVKSITTGEGGAVTTNSEVYARELRMFQTHGITKTSADYEWQYDVPQLGYNYRITDFQAELGLSQLSRLGEFIEKRNAVADRYRKKLGGVAGVTLPPEPTASVRHSYHLFPILVSNRDNVILRLRAEGIIAQVHYPALHRLTINAYSDWRENSLLTSTWVTDQILSLPMWPGLSRARQLRVIDALLRALDR